MYLKYTYTDLESGKEYEEINEIIEISFNVDTNCSILLTATNKKLYLDTDNLERHTALIDAWMLGLMRKEPAASLQGTVLSLPKTMDNAIYQEYYEAALDEFEKCRGYVLFIGTHSYTF